MRRAMGQKKKGLMEELSIKFISGARTKGINKRKSEEIFSMIEKFAQYGFNKSHSTAYAYIAYQTAWLKTYYPSEFMSANLTSEMGNIDRIVILFNECKKLNIVVYPPDINVSKQEFYPINRNTISYGLNAIKNVGTKALEAIISEITLNGKYNSIFDLCKRVDLQKVNKRVIESLIMAGACDSLEGNRLQLFSAIDEAIQFGQKSIIRNRDQVNIFSDISQEDLIKIPSLSDLEDWDENTALTYEKEVLGTYISGHPLLEHSDEIEEFTTIDFNENRISVNRKNSSRRYDI